MLRALPPIVLLGACAAPEAPPAAPALPVTAASTADVCRPITKEAHWAAPRPAPQSSSFAGLHIFSTHSRIACRVDGPGLYSCDVSGETYLDVGLGPNRAFFHIPAGRTANIHLVNGAHACRAA